MGLLRPLRAGVPMLLISATGVAAAFAMDGGGPWQMLIRRGIVFSVVTAAGVVPLLWSWRTQSASGGTAPATTAAKASHRG